jgi:hypothetical protein
MLNANFSGVADKTEQKARFLFLRILCSTEETAAYAQKPEQVFSRRGHHSITLFPFFHV